MDKIFDLNNLTEMEKLMLSHIYYDYKSAEIGDDFSKYLTSRAKDEASYRWRYADNEKIYCEAMIIRESVKRLLSELKIARNEKVDAINYDLSVLQEEYKKYVPEVKRIESERKMYENYDIDLSDLKVSFEQIKNAMPSILFKNKTTFRKKYSNLAKKFKIQEETLVSGTMGE